VPPQTEIAGAFITETENAKKSPAIKPQPSAATSVKAKSNWSAVAIRPPVQAFRNLGFVVTIPIFFVKTTHEITSIHSFWLIANTDQDPLQGARS